jgi:uncharacterized protein (DUF4415 family)
MKEKNIVSFSAEELQTMKSNTDWDRIHNMTDEENETNILSDPDSNTHLDWSTAKVVMPTGNQARITVSVKPWVLDFFKKGGRGYQTRMNAVLEAYVRQVTGLS